MRRTSRAHSASTNTALPTSTAQSATVRGAGGARCGCSTLGSPTARTGPSCAVAARDFAGIRVRRQRAVDQRRGVEARLLDLRAGVAEREWPRAARHERELLGHPCHLERRLAAAGYYLLLDLAVAAVAWRKAWRALNLLAFFSTYAVATLWGVLRYSPEQFASTEPFVLAYLVLFTGVALVNAWRRSPRLAGVIDGTLVFGTPLVSLLAQARLVEGRQLGMALS